MFWRPNSTIKNYRYPGARGPWSSGAWASGPFGPWLRRHWSKEDVSKHPHLEVRTWLNANGNNTGWFGLLNIYYGRTNFLFGVNGNPDSILVAYTPYDAVIIRFFLHESYITLQQPQRRRRVTAVNRVIMIGLLLWTLYPRTDARRQLVIALLTA